MQALEAQRDRRRGRALPGSSGPLVQLSSQRPVGPSKDGPEEGEGGDGGDGAGVAQGLEGLERSEWVDGGGPRRRERGERGMPGLGIGERESAGSAKGGAGARSSVVEGGVGARGGARGGVGPSSGGGSGEWDGALEDQRRELLELQRK